MKYLIMLLFGLSSIQLTSCEKGVNQENQEEPTFYKMGEIEPVTCESISIMCTQSPQGEYILRNNEEYQALLTVMSPHPDCGSYTLPEIDFNEHTLIGFISSISGCESPDVSYVIEEGDGDNYTFTVSVVRKGLCERNNPIIIWCLIPKLEEGATMNFIVDINSLTD